MSLTWCNYIEICYIVLFRSRHLSTCFVVLLPKVHAALFPSWFFAAHPNQFSSFLPLEILSSLRLIYVPKCKRRFPVGRPSYPSTIYITVKMTQAEVAWPCFENHATYRMLCLSAAACVLRAPNMVRVSAVVCGRPPRRRFCRPFPVAKKVPLGKGVWATIAFGPTLDHD